MATSVLLTLGSWSELVLLVRVIMVSQVVVPRVVLPGTALGSSQKETQDTMTNIQQGT